MALAAALSALVGAAAACTLVGVGAVFMVLASPGLPTVWWLLFDTAPDAADSWVGLALAVLAAPAWARRAMRP